MTRRTRRSRREGVVAILVVFLMAALIGVAAFAIDTGHLYKVRTELQNVADATALAAAKSLDGTAAGIALALVQVTTVSTANEAYNSAAAVATSDVEFGHWNTLESTFTSYGLVPDADEVGSANAVRIHARRNASNGALVHAPFSAFMNSAYANRPVGAYAIAVGGGPVSECAFPMVVSECQVAAAVLPDCGTCFMASNANTDTAGWTALVNGAASQDSISGAIATACFSGASVDGVPEVDDTSHECAGSCGTVADETIQVNNGNFFTQNEDQVCGLIRRILERNGTPEYFTVKVPVLALESGETCADVQYSGDKEITGYATVDIYGVKCGNSQPAIVDLDYPTPVCVTPSDKFVAAVLHCDVEEDDAVGGGGFDGDTTRRVRLVQ